MTLGGRGLALYAYDLAQEDRTMKSTILALAAAALVTACTSEEATVQPATQAPAAAPAAAPMVEPAAGSSQSVVVTYTPPSGMAAAQRMANMYCAQHGKGTAQLMSDDPPGHATFACPGM